MSCSCGRQCCGSTNPSPSPSPNPNPNPSTNPNPNQVTSRLTSFCEFNALRKNQLLAFYDQVAPHGFSSVTEFCGHGIGR